MTLNVDNMRWLLFVQRRWRQHDRRKGKIKSKMKENKEKRKVLTDHVRNDAEEGELFVVLHETFMFRIMQFAGPIVVQNVPEDVGVTIEKIFFRSFIEEELALVWTCRRIKIAVNSLESETLFRCKIVKDKNRSNWIFRSLLMFFCVFFCEFMTFIKISSLERRVQIRHF